MLAPHLRWPSPGRLTARARHNAGLTSVGPILRPPRKARFFLLLGPCSRAPQRHPIEQCSCPTRWTMLWPA